MTDYEYILVQAKKFHYAGWNDEELRKCVELLPNLTREQQVALYRSKWVDENLRKTVFKVLFADKVGKREERIKTEDTAKLILEFQDKKGGNVSLARKELRESSGRKPGEMPTPEGSGAIARETKAKAKRATGMFGITVTSSAASDGGSAAGGAE